MDFGRSDPGEIAALLVSCSAGVVARPQVAARGLERRSAESARNCDFLLGDDQSAVQLNQADALYRARGH